MMVEKNHSLSAAGSTSTRLPDPIDFSVSYDYASLVGVEREEDSGR